MLITLLSLTFVKQNNLSNLPFKKMIKKISKPVVLNKAKKHPYVTLVKRFLNYPNYYRVIEYSLRILKFKVIRQDKERTL